MTLRQRWTQTSLPNKLLIVTGGLVAFGTLFYAGAAAFQICLMQQNARDSAAQVERLVSATNGAITKATEENSKALTKALGEDRAAFDATLSQSRDQFRQDQRPYLWIANGKTGSPGFIKLLEKDKSGFLQAFWDNSIYNFGKTPAYHVGRKFFIQVGNKHPKSQSYGEGANNPPTLIAPTGEASVKVLSSPNIIQGEIDDLQKPHSGQTINIWGTITYADSYGTNYESDLCLSRLDSGVVQYCNGNQIK